MKKFIVLVIISYLLLLPWSIADASEKNMNLEIFPAIQTRQIVALGDSLYAYLDDASVSKWDISEDAPRLFCQLPEVPRAESIAYRYLDDKAKARWDESVSFFATGDDALWGVNAFTGRIGKINENGIQWDTVQLDITYLMPDEYPWPLRVVNAFVMDNMLYTYIAYDDGVYPQNNYDLLKFNLSDGTCRVLNVQNAQGVCTYKPGMLLLLYFAEDDNWIVKMMDLSTGEILDSPFLSFSDTKDKPIGGLAFDPIMNRLLFTTKSQVWAASEEESFSTVALVPVSDIVGETVAFSLEDGRYALFTDYLYIRDVETQFEVQETLHLWGCMDQTIYKSFTNENPNIPIDFTYELLSADEIAQSLITEDQTADLYATFADHTFSAIVKKGYTYDLSSSKILSEDIQSMYPNIRSVITDGEGKPVAYPYQLLLGHWQVNELLWQHVFGNTSLPTTYDEFLDAMVLWESKYADDFSEIDFSGNFDHAYWVRNIVNAYAQQYGQTDLFMSLDTPVLRSALEKLEQVRDVRKEYGRSTHFSDEYMPKIDMFITAGFNNVLLDPPELPSQGFQTDDIQEGIYTDMPALVFAQGEKSLIPGKMLVWFVNPYSQNKELAIRYLEHAARMENNPRAYYATHPYLNDPLEYAGYEQSVQEMMRRRDDLIELLEKAEDADRSDIEDDLIYVENWLSNQEKMKWMISETAINIYRSFAPNISFFEDNQYITPDGSKMLRQLEGLYQRYADGVINLDAFLKELDEKMHMLYVEGE